MLQSMSIPRSLLRIIPAPRQGDVSTRFLKRIEAEEVYGVISALDGRDFLHTIEIEGHGIAAKQ